VGRLDGVDPGRGATPVEEPLVGPGREYPPEDGSDPEELVGPALGREGALGRADGIELGRTPPLDPREGLGAEGRE